MSGKFVQLSVLLLALLAVVMAQSGQSAAKTKVSSCYQCNSADDKQADCEFTDKLQDSWKKTCKAPTSSNLQYSDAVGCRKIQQTVDGGTRTVRECAFSGENVEAQKRTGNKGILIYYYQCSSDNCNGSSTIAASLGVLLLACVASFLRQ